MVDPANTLSISSPIGCVTLVTVFLMTLTPLWHESCSRPVNLEKPAVCQGERMQTLFQGQRQNARPSRHFAIPDCPYYRPVGRGLRCRIRLTVSVIHCWSLYRWYWFAICCILLLKCCRSTFLLPMPPPRLGTSIVSPSKYDSLALFVKCWHGKCLLSACSQTHNGGKKRHQHCSMVEA